MKTIGQDWKPKYEIQGQNWFQNISQTIHWKGNFSLNCCFDFNSKKSYTFTGRIIRNTT